MCFCVAICIKLTANESTGGRTQSGVLDTLLRLIETASGTNRLRDRDCAMAREREEEEGKEKGERDGWMDVRVSKIEPKTKWHW